MREITEDEERSDVGHLKTWSQPWPMTRPNFDFEVVVMLDPPSHQRYAIADDEIVDRARALSVATEKPVTLVTCDVGQAMRAKMAGLNCEWIRQDHTSDVPTKNRK